MSISEAAYCDVEVFDAPKVAKIQERLSTIDFNLVSTILKAVADENRAKIIYALSQGESLCVCDIANILHINNANASRHLRLLYKSGVVDYVKEGKMSFYTLKHPENSAFVLELIDHIQAEHKL